jgi:hypothetical protein
MKPIATVHWTHDGKEYSQDYYRFDFLEKQIRNLTANNDMFTLCVTNTNQPLPSVTSINGDLRRDNTTTM